MKIKKCDKCKITYEKNKKFNMVEQGLGQDTEPGTAIGYMIPPIIDGIIISSTCGTGKKLDLCDNCITELFDFLNISNNECITEDTIDNTEIVKIIDKEVNNYGKRKQNRIRRIRSKRRNTL